jgi:hypothetical protein
MQAVRDLMAPERTVCMARIDSVIPSPALGALWARPDSTASAAE